MNKRKRKKLRVLQRKQTESKVQWYVKFGYYKQEKKTEENARRQEN
jgi:hypothetical protein